MICSVMHRVRIEIEQWQYDTLRTVAEREGRGISCIVREILAEALLPEPQVIADWIREVAGIGCDPQATTDHHDEYLYSAPDEFA